jgi:hypothetical protein
MLELYGFCDCKGSVISPNSQTFYTLFNNKMSNLLKIVESLQQKVDK